MITERFEERLLLELKTRVRERTPERQADAHSVTAGVDALVEALVVRRRRRRPRFGTVAVAAGLAVALATAVFTATNGALGGDAARHPLFHVANAAYAVQQEPTGIVKLTILDGDGRPNVDKLRGDLAKAGIQARVLAGVPACGQPQSPPTPEFSLLPPAQVTPPRSALENGRFVYYMDPREVVPGVTFSVLYGQSLRTIEMALTQSDDVPDCMSTGTVY